MTTQPTIAFSDLNLGQPVLQALAAVGYEMPSPIQAQTIPLLLDGSDLVGQAQTGTGKTAAFALPLLSRLDLNNKSVQVLVLTPTRELAIQVAEAFQTYAKGLNGFKVLPIYGGQDYRTQLRALERGVHVVVGTPGRVMDHMRRKTLKLDGLTALVLDEADEMLRMGFIDDVEWILEQTPKERQIALFSATMPAQIRRIANRYLKEPEHVTVKSTTSTASTIRQRVWNVAHRHKFDALKRILEAEPFDAMLVFVQTKTSTVEVAEKLQSAGFACAALNGDIPQNQRERTVDNLKKGKLDIIVATDVAARGLDVKRVSHVINFDIPTDVEAYVHRIGRTGRAGRHGDAILFVTPRERRMLFAIEKLTGKPIEPMEMPSNEQINEQRIAKLKERINETVSHKDVSFFEELVESYHQEYSVPHARIAAALAHMMQGDKPFLFNDAPPPKQRVDRTNDRKVNQGRPDNKRTQAANISRDSAFLENELNGSERPAAAKRKPLRPLEKGMERFRLEVGSVNDVKPGNIVGAIANEAGIDSQYIGQIVIESDHSIIDLPEGMPKEIFSDLKKTRVCGVPLRLSKLGDSHSRRNDAGKSNSAGNAPRKHAAKPGGKPAHKTSKAKNSADKKSRVKKRDKTPQKRPA